MVKSVRNGHAYEMNSGFGGVESMRFETWVEAYQALQRHIKLHNLKLPSAKEKAEALKEKGRQRARDEIARSCVELYNDYLNGCVFGIVIAKFELNDDGEPEFVEDDAVFGYYGDDDAYECLKAEIEARDDYRLSHVSRHAGIPSGGFSLDKYRAVTVC